MPAIEKDLGLSHGEAGSLFLLVSTGYFIALLGSGFISSRITHKKTVILSSTALGIALLGVSFSNSLWGIRFGLFILGMAAGPYIPSGIAALTSLIDSKHWGKAIAIHELAPNLSFIVAPLVSEALMKWFAWQGVLASLGVTSIILGIAFALFGRGGESYGEAPNLDSCRTLLSKPSFRIMIVLFSMAVSGSLGIYAMLPLFLIVERGMSRNWANTLIALSRISGPGMGFLAGWASDRFGPKQTMRSFFLLSGMMTILLGIMTGAWIIVPIFMQPMLAVCFFPAGFAALSLISPARIRNVAVSLTVPFAFLIGSGAIPNWLGYMGDAGSFALGIVLVGGMVFVGSVLSLYLKFPDNQGE